MRLSFKIIYFFFLFSFCIIFACEKERIVETQTNSPPIITLLNILPEKPNQESQIHLSIQSRDSDGNDIAFQYQWLKNNDEIVGANESVLKSEAFKKGDLIRVRVTPSDGKEEGKPFLSDPVKISNSPPAIQEVRIEPMVPYVADDLKVFIKSSDIDGDSVNYTYQWEKNGEILNEERKEILEKGKFKKGDSITVSVTPDDREAAGKTKKSEPVSISNGPPIIVSSPPTKVDRSIYVYSVLANDPDEDPISFTLKSSPKGMEIDKVTGLIRWEIRKEDRGSHLIDIEVSDSEGASSFQRFTLRVEYK